MYAKPPTCIHLFDFVLEDPTMHIHLHLIILKTCEYNKYVLRVIGIQYLYILCSPNLNYGHCLIKYIHE